MKSPAPSRQIVRDSVCPNRCSPSTSLAHPPSTAVYYLGPIPQGASYLSPQRNSSSLKCECNTVMYRYLTSSCAHLPTANCRVAQSDYGVHCVPKRHRPVVDGLAGVLSLSLHRVPPDHPSERRCSQLGLLGLRRTCSILVVCCKIPPLTSLPRLWVTSTPWPQNLQVIRQSALHRFLRRSRALLAVPRPQLHSRPPLAQVV